MASNSHIQNPSLMDIQFPQPTRPLNINDTFSSSPSLNMINDANKAQDHHNKPPHEYYVCMDTIIEEEEQEEEDQYRFEDAERLLGSMFEIYRKLPKKVQRKLNLEGILSQYLIREKDSRQEDFTFSSRGLEGSQVEELEQRLERFKIRTLDPNGGTVVKDESTK